MTKKWKIGRWLASSFAGADRIHFPFDRRFLQGMEWQAVENIHARHDLPGDFRKHGTLLFFGARRSCRIFKAPMRGNRLTWPDRAHFAGGVVADSDNEIHFWCARQGELVPALAA